MTTKFRSPIPDFGCLINNSQSPCRLNAVAQMSDISMDYFKQVSLKKGTGNPIFRTVIAIHVSITHPRSDMMLDGETMQHEFESEYEYEYENEYESEFEGDGEGEYEGEEFLGDILKGVGSALGLGEGEYEYESEYESEEFIGKLAKRAKGLVSKITPILKQVTPNAVRAVGTAVSGNPKLGQTLASMASQLMREGEFEYELTNEFEGEYEYESSPQPEALAEVLATMASKVQSEAEAEAYTGAFTARIIPIKSASMQNIFPGLTKGAATLTRTLRKHPATRPLVKTVPTIMARTGKVLSQQAAQGKPISRNTAAKVMATQTSKVLGNPNECARVLTRSSRVAQKATKRMPARV